MCTLGLIKEWMTVVKWLNFGDVLVGNQGELIIIFKSDFRLCHAGHVFLPVRNIIIRQYQVYTK